MRDSPGKLIVLAGIDGSGKTEQTRRLVERLRATGRVVHEEEFPQYETTFFGATIGRYLKNEFGPAAQIDPHLASVLYAGDRWEAKARMEAALARGEVIVSNRYVSANLAHQGGKIASDEEREAFFAWVEELEYRVFQIPMPDRVVFLWLPIEVASDLVGRKAQRSYLGERKKDGHEADMSHLAHAQRVYQHLSQTRPNWVRVSCVDDAGALLSIDAVAERVWQAVSQYT